MFKNINIKIILIIFVVSLSIENVNCQNYAPYNANSKSKSRGLPQISIPIYDISSNSLRCPIALFYDASGIKVCKEADWVGLGWSLFAGGFISRRIIGLPD